MDIPVYLISGFLDGGKTSFINDILEEGFAEEERTLLICCEEGNVSYSNEALQYVDLVVFKGKDDLEYGNLKKLQKQYRPEQIIIEYNGMWLFKDLEEVMPANWTLYQVMSFVKASTFEVFSRNMGQLMMEKVTNADMLVFNRCTPELKESLRKRNLRMVNRRCDIFLEDCSGKAENYLRGDECPFDMSQEVIDVPDEDFGVWYVDVMDHPERYEGKKVHMKMVMLHSSQYPGVCCPGRFAMVCCAEDITFLGIMARGAGLEKFEDRDWMEVTARMEIVEHPAYDTGDGPCMDILSVEVCTPPAEDVVSF